MKKGTKSFKKLLREIVGNNIRDQRIKKRINQTKLSKMINVSRTQLSYYETGRSLPDLDIVIMLAQALDCSIADIYSPDKLDSLKKIFDFDEMFVN